MNPELRRERLRQQEEVRQQEIAAKREHQAHQKFIDRVEQASKHHPEIDQKVFRDVIAAYEAESSSQAQIEQDIRRNGGPSGLVKLEFLEMRNDFRARVEERLKNHGSAAAAALHAVAQENQPESMFTPMVRMFHNTDRGGIQWGSVIGALLGGGMSYYLGNASDSSPLLTLGLTLVTGLMGAYVGTQIMPGKEVTPTPNFRVPSPQKGKAKSPEAEVTEPKRTENISQSMPVKPAPIPGVNHSPSDTPPAPTYIAEIPKQTPDGPTPGN